MIVFTDRTAFERVYARARPFLRGVGDGWGAAEDGEPHN